jgi:hypothetical protein
MSYLDELVDITIATDSKAPTRPGFGTALILSQKWPIGMPNALTATMADASELLDAGFLTTDEAYQLALIHKAQSPAPKTFKVGRRSTLATMVIKLTVTIATTGYVYAFSVDGKDYTYTVLAGATTTTVATALAALITGGTAGATATAAVAVITITAAAGKVFDVAGWVANAMTIDDTTADPGVTADLAAILAEDNGWYGVIPDHFGKAEALAAALWVESEHKIMIVDTFQSACLDSTSTTDIMYALKQLGYARTGTMHSKNSVLHRSGAAWLAGRFVAPPGSDTWKFKSLTSVAASKYKTGERNAIKAKKGNWYETVAGLDMTAEGWSASGEFYGYYARRGLAPLGNADPSFRAVHERA